MVNWTPIHLQEEYKIPPRLPQKIWMAISQKRKEFCWWTKWPELLCQIRIAKILVICVGHIAWAPEGTQSSIFHNAPCLRLCVFIYICISVFPSKTCVETSLNAFCWRPVNFHKEEFFSGFCLCSIILQDLLLRVSLELQFSFLSLGSLYNFITLSLYPSTET